MEDTVYYSLPFISDAFKYTKHLIKSEIDKAKSYNEVEKILTSYKFEGREKELTANYEIYRKAALRKWLNNLKKGACVQSIGTAEGWQISFYFDNYEFKGFREDEIIQIKQAALDRLNEDSTASKLGTFTKVIKVEKDICSSTAFICSCI